MTNTARFGLVLSEQEKQALFEIARLRRTSVAATVRWLIWREKQRRERMERGKTTCTD
ncbi:MAG TPA: hypothetical protein PLJ78_07060 [Anaerolineae bacterium]|nr:hypothetical protein [Anaerolineae bacterium]HQK13682.1 hypothetical protein [Anaerolineae bacterium]